MRFPQVVLLASALLCLTPVARAAESSDPDQIFLNAYMSFQQAEKLEADGSFKAALAKYRYAGSVLDQLQQRNPDWNPMVLQFRKKKVSEAVQKLQDKIALETPPTPAPTAVPQPGGLDPNLLPGISPTPSNPTADTGNNGGDTFERAMREARDMRNQMAAVRAQLEQSRQQLEAVQKEKARIAHQLEDATSKLSQSTAASKEQTEKLRKAETALQEQAERAALNEGKAKARETETQKALQAQLDEARAEAAKVKEQLTRAKASETDLQAKLDSASKQFEAQSKEKDQAATAQAETLKADLEKLRQALDAAKADRAVAEEQGELLHQRAARLTQERDTATAQSTKLAAENTDLTTKLDTANKRIESLAEVEQKLIAMAKEREAAKAEADKKTTELAAAKKTVETVTAERDNALAQLAKAQEAKTQAEKLLAENTALTKQLDTAQKTIAAFNAAAPEKDRQIAALKAQLTGVQEQLDAAQKEGGINRNLIAELQKQLDAANTAKASSAGEDQKKLTQENDLLRGIVLRELKEQARREQSRKLVLAELERMKVRSKVLTEQVSLLSQPAVTLSAQERALFKTPQMEIVDNGPGALAISIAAPATSPSARKGSDSLEGDLPSNPAQTSDDARPAAQTGTPSGATVSTETNPVIPPELRPLAREARDHSDHGRYLEAERIYEKIVSKAPSNIYALSNLGVARFQAGHLKQAEETFKKVLAIAPTDAFAHCTLGIIYFRQAKYDDAITHLTQAVSADPKNAPAHNFLGITAAQKGWPQAAQKELDTALQIAPDYADAHYNMAVLLTTLQPPQKETAAKHYNKALELGMKPSKEFEAKLK